MGVSHSVWGWPAHPMLHTVPLWDPCPPKRISQCMACSSNAAHRSTVGPLPPEANFPMHGVLIQCCTPLHCGTPPLEVCLPMHGLLIQCCTPFHCGTPAPRSEFPNAWRAHPMLHTVPLWVPCPPKRISQCMACSSNAAHRSTVGPLPSKCVSQCMAYSSNAAHRSTVGPLPPDANFPMHSVLIQCCTPFHCGTPPLEVCFPMHGLLIQCCTPFHCGTPPLEVCFPMHGVLIQCCTPFHCGTPAPRSEFPNAQPAHPMLHTVPLLDPSPRSVISQCTARSSNAAHHSTVGPLPPE